MDKPLAEAWVRISQDERSSLLGNVLAQFLGCSPCCLPWSGRASLCAFPSPNLSLQPHFPAILGCVDGSSGQQPQQDAGVESSGAGSSGSESTAGSACPIYGHLHVKLR